MTTVQPDTLKELHELHGMCRVLYEKYIRRAPDLSETTRQDPGKVHRIPPAVGQNDVKGMGIANATLIFYAKGAWVRITEYEKDFGEYRFIFAKHRLLPWSVDFYRKVNTQEWPAFKVCLGKPDEEKIREAIIALRLFM